MSTNARWGAALLLLLGMMPSPTWSQGAPKGSTAQRRSASEGIVGRPPTGPLRELLHRRMEQHGIDMTRLVERVVLLRYDEIVALAERIASAPRLLKPEPGDGEDLAARLPPRIFLLDDELRDRARRLSDAARARDHALIGKSFGLVAESCVMCHAAYRGAP